MSGNEGGVEFSKPQLAPKKPSSGAAQAKTHFFSVSLNFPADSGFFPGDLTCYVHRDLVVILLQAIG